MLRRRFCYAGGVFTECGLTVTTHGRIAACLQGIAVGDAIGKQTENLSHDDVRRWYPDGVRGFEGTLGSPIPRYRENRRYEWLVGETTDDTERTLAVARAIVTDGTVRHSTVGRELLGCRKSVHPGVKSLWEFHEAADPTRVTTRHDGCGAAIRVAPVGILLRPERLDEILVAAREASISTHGGLWAITAAAATAAAVSAAVDGMTAPEILALAGRAATIAGGEHGGSAGVTFAGQLRIIHQDLLQQQPAPSEMAARYFPNNPLTIVPLALALATALESAEAAILVAANIGGDSDSVASIAGGILGARAPGTVNQRWLAAVEAINDHRLESVAATLTPLRR
jgi:ADP-ribosylglycohydrolase